MNELKQLIMGILTTMTLRMDNQAAWIRSLERRIEKLEKERKTNNAQDLF